MTTASPLTRALNTLGIIGLLTVIAIRVLDKPAWTWALIGFLGYAALTVFTVAALEGGDTVDAPERRDGPETCLSPDPFPRPATGFAPRFEPAPAATEPCPGHYFPLPDELGFDPDAVTWRYGNCDCGAPYDGSHDQPFAVRVNPEEN